MTADEAKLGVGVRRRSEQNRAEVATATVLVEEGDCGCTGGR